MARKQQQQKPQPKKSSSKTQSSNQLPLQISPSEPSPEQHEDLRDQQRLLDIFTRAFNAVLAADDFPHLLREVKQALFDRDFDAAFGREEHLQVYAARWSPTRALCYASIFRAIGEHLEHLWIPNDSQVIGILSNGGGEKIQEEDKESSPPGQSTLNVLSIGGCAAEHVALASCLHANQSNGSLVLIDSAPWTQVISILHDRVTSPPIISKYASAAVKAANKPLLHKHQLSTTFLQDDILSMDRQRLAELASKPLLVTLMFTLNELYTNHGIGKTTTFLKTLGDILPHGSLLLVVDSPGSYSEAAVGKECKRYPMQWLLDHTLLETRSPPKKGLRWRRLESQDSVWFRLPEALSYPIQLENMRYQMHLYRIEDVLDLE